MPKSPENWLEVEKGLAVPPGQQPTPYVTEQDLFARKVTIEIKCEKHGKRVFAWDCVAPLPAMSLQDARELGAEMMERIYSSQNHWEKH